ncbi:WD repeat-containing protein 81 isoform X1 [Bombyx mori]|uniref:BEACH domain-containing protein n=2 Tax=Bombyx mori TaxID=7091 RepID=A0A8R2C5Y1_BOMMO|nr:WD repeat-containing protein 81 isoform X1 [Bombyx mori]
MEYIVKELDISSKNVTTTSTPGVYAVTVHTRWIKQWLNIENENFSNVSYVSQPDESTHQQFRRMFIKVIRKKSSKVLPLPRYKLNENTSETPLTFSQLLQYVSQSNQRSLWKESYKKYSQNTDSSRTENLTVNLIEHDQLTSEILFRLYCCNLIKIKDFSYEEIIPSMIVLKPHETHNNLLAAMFIFETSNNFFIVYRGSYENNLLDCLNYTPNLIDKNYGRGLFVIYQLLNLAKAMSDRGLSLGALTLQDIYLSENLWLQVVPMIVNNIHCLDPTDIYEQSKRRTQLNQVTLPNSETSQSNDECSWRKNAVKLEKICMLWLNGMISNLDYLKHLNVLAGRSPSDPQTHFMVPWVTDFSSRCGRNWRDLTKSKYRLNKGDHQLDMTYDVTSSADQIPHHVSDALSDITCYVYLARRTPKEVLCKYVRNKWVPAEYPASIQRMQEWTPDECIPEFYTDPTVFKSIHEDLPDLDIPSWASCVEDFITKHREALESTHVSENLHHWIDIAFGYKLSGQASVKAKNVCLSLVDGHTRLRRGGTVQLFTAPHPPRAPRAAPPAPPALHWTLPRDAKKSVKNESSDEVSEDEEEPAGVPQHVSCLHVPPQRHRSRHKGSSRARSLSKTPITDDSQQVTESRASSHSRHYRVQRSEMGKGVIYLPKEFNPVASIQALEALDNFKTKCFFSKANEKDEKENLDSFKSQQDGKAKGSAIKNSERNDDNSFTNRMFLGSYDYIKKLNHDTHLESIFKKRKNRSFVTRYTTDAAIYKQFITENRKQDMLVIGCLIVEIFLHAQMRPLRMFHEDFIDRYKCCRTVFKYNFNALPKCVTYMASLLLDVQQPSLSFKDGLCVRDELFKKNPVTDKGLPFPTPAQTLQPLLAQHLIPFPQSFTVLYKLLSALHEYELTSNELNILSCYVCDGIQCDKYQNIDKAKTFFAQQIAEGKIMACVTHLDVLLNQIERNTQFDVMDIFLAHYVELLQNKETSVLAAWYLFDIVSKALGPNETRKKLMKYILNLYEDDDFIVDRPEQHKLTDADDTTATALTNKQKLVKLYHHIFLLQLMVRLGLQCFLDNFTQHLVEAVGGYKDVSSEINSPGHLNHKRAMANKKPRYSDDNLKSALSTATDIFSPDTSYGSENITTPIVEKAIEVNNSKEKDIDNRSENELFHFESDKDRPSTNCRSKSPTESIDSYGSNVQEAHTPSPSRDRISPSTTKYLTPNAKDHSVIITNEDNIDASVAKKPTSPTIDIPTKSMFTSYLRFAEENPSEVEVRRESHSRQVKSLEFSKNTDVQNMETFNFCEDNMRFKENSSCKISDMSSESLIWLAHRLGPVLTCRYITRNLLKMLTLCYIGKDNLVPWEGDERDDFDDISIVNSRVVGDKSAVKVINCLTSIVAMYGEQLIIFQYLPHMGELIASCRRRLSAPLEGGVVACLQLVKYLVPYMSDVKIMEQLQDTFLKIILQPALRLSSTSRCAYPNGAVARRAVCRKLVSALHVLALRVGPEMTRRHLCVPALQRFFLAFDKATGKIDNWPKQDDLYPEATQDPDGQDPKEGFLEICRDGTTAEWRVQDGRVVRADLPDRPDLACTPPRVTAQPDSGTLTAQEELLMVFDEELAHKTYTSFTRLVGTETMERCLKNLDTVKGLCRKYEQNHSISSPLQIARADKRVQSSYSDEPLCRRAGATPSRPHDAPADHISSSNSFGSNVTLVGNRIDVASDAGTELAGQGEGFDVVSYKMDNGVKSERHLRGDWLIYWEHEIGRADKDTGFNLKQIKLQTFAGHTHSVKSIHCLDNEHSFMSGSKDKTVKLWSLRNQGDGNATTQCNWTYTGHKKGVLSLSFIESQRLAVSTDSVVHIWDPFMESVVSQLDSIKSPVSIVRALPGASSTVVAATNDATVRVIDARDPNHSYELKLWSGGSTYIRCMCAWDARWVACGLASGHVAVLELRTGLPLAAWKPHDGEVLRLAAVDQHRLLSSGLDQVTALWKPDDGELISYLKGSPEPVHCLSVHNEELISGTTNNRIGVHTSLQQDAGFSSTKLRSDTFKGVLTCMSVLPMNRLLLLGSDNGTISLLC